MQQKRDSVEQREIFVEQWVALCTRAKKFILLPNMCSVRKEK